MRPASGWFRWAVVVLLLLAGYPHQSWQFFAENDPNETLREDLNLLASDLKNFKAVLSDLMESLAREKQVNEQQRKDIDDHKSTIGRLETVVAELTAQVRDLSSSGRDYTHRTSCQEARFFSPFLPSGMYWIDPDGQGVGDEPINVHCNMTSGTTSVQHDSEAPTDVAHCIGPGCYSRSIRYNATLVQLTALADKSAKCHQSLKYECRQAPLRNQSWWEDRHGGVRYSWSGLNNTSHKCQCGIDGNCVDPNYLCNCDTPASNGQILSDIGLLRNKTVLPITKLKLGARESVTKEVFTQRFTLGRLQCSGTAKQPRSFVTDQQEMKTNLLGLENRLDILSSATGDKIKALNAKSQTNDAALTQVKISVAGLLKNFTFVDKIMANKEFIRLCGEADLTDRDKNKIIQQINNGTINVNEKDERGNNALHLLLKNRNLKSEQLLLDLARFLLDKGLDVKDNNFNGDNVLHLLCWKNKKEKLVELAKLFIDRGIDVKEKDDQGNNALHLLCEYNSNAKLLEVIRMLIEKGVDVKEKNRYGLTALHLLCWNNKSDKLLDVAKYLIEKGVEVREKTWFGNTALHLLCFNDKNENLVDVAKLLVDKGIDVRDRNKNGSNALLVLCINNTNGRLVLQLSKFLIEKGVDPKDKNNDGKNALYYIRNNDKLSNKNEIIDLLS